MLDLIGGTLGMNGFLSTRKEVERSSDLGPITKSVQHRAAYWNLNRLRPV